MNDMSEANYRVTADELRQFIERFERLEMEKKDISDQQKEVMAEAKGRGYDTKVMRKVIALRKRDKDDIAEDPVFRSRFETEARHAAALHHPGIAAVFDVGERAASEAGGQPRPFLVMELVDGQPLSALLSQGRDLDPAAVRDLMIPVPELYSVSNLSNLLDVSALYERVASPKCCVKSSHGLLCILARSTNAGSRGWESTLHAAAKDSDGTVRVCMQAIGVCFSGLHPCLHPAARRDWRSRFVTLRAWRAQNQTTEFKELVKKAPGAIKEAVRLHLAAVLAADAATLAAFAYTQQPPGQLVLPPQSLPPSAMIAAMRPGCAANASRTAARSLYGRTRVSPAIGAGTPAEPGRPSVATPDPDSASSPSEWPW